MYTLSIILNLHRENELADKTIQNLKNILSTKHSWGSVECIAILDNSNEVTKNIVMQHQVLFAKIEEVSYADLALSRNHGVALAQNNFVLFADGDDYCSHTVLQSLYDRFCQHYGKKNAHLANMKESEHIALFPENLVWFPEVSKMRYFPSNAYMVQNNKFIHCYISKIALYRGLLEKYPIRKNTPSYGYEDWDLNNRLLDAGVQFKVADYTLYYRKDTIHSLLTGQFEQKAIVRNSDAYLPTHMDIKTVFPKSKLRLFADKISLLFGKRREECVLVQKTESITEDIKFLQAYGEAFSTKEVLYHSAEHYTKHIFIDVEIYKTLLSLLQGITELYVYEERENIHKDIQKCLYLNLNRDLEGWTTLSEERQFHTFMKAMMNSSIQKIHIIQSPFVLKTLKYYSDVYQAYAIEVIVIS